MKNYSFSLFFTMFLDIYLYNTFLSLHQICGVLGARVTKTAVLTTKQNIENINILMYKKNSIIFLISSINILNMIRFANYMLGVSYLHF